MTPHSPKRKILSMTLAHKMLSNPTDHPPKGPYLFKVAGGLLALSFKGINGRDRSF